MKRRKFLKTTANAIAGGFWVSSCSSFGGHANNHIELAAIGCGRMGRNDIKNILAIAADHNALFTSVCDVDQNRLRAARQLIEERYAEQGIRHQVKEYSDFRKLLRNRSIDVVNIATPDHCHAEVAIAAAEAGKDIYLQKPLTYTIAEGRKLVKAVRDNKRVLQTGSQQRSSVYFRRVCELVRHGKIGELKQIEVNIGEDEGYGDGSPMEVPGSLDYRGWLGSAPYKPYTVDRVHPQNSFGRPGWMQVSDYTHGMITNWGSHMMDIAHWGSGMDFGGPTEIEASAGYPDRGLFNVHTSLTARNYYQNGLELLLVSYPKNDEHVRPGVTFRGSEGWVRCERGFFSSSDRNLLRWEPKDQDRLLAVSTNHYGNFLEAVRQHKDPICPVEVGHRSNSVCILNSISAKLRRSLRWDYTKEVFVDDPEANRFLSDMRIYDEA